MIAWPKIRFERITESERGVLHDNPSDSIRIVLRGSFMLLFTTRPPIAEVEIPVVEPKFRGFLSITCLKAEDAHWIELSRLHKKCLTLLITWPPRREWGYWCETRGLTGEVTYPLTTPGGAVNYVLQYTGYVAKWVHHAVFAEWGGPTLGEPVETIDGELE